MKKGTTLIEIMLAIGIMAAAIIPMFGLLSYSDRGTREQDAEGIAANWAKEKMNWLMNVASRANLESGIGGAELSDSPLTVKGNTFFGKFTVYPVENSDLKFQVPQMNFHDPRKCPPPGDETQTGVLASPITPSVKDVLPALGTMIYDIKLEVTWKLANESTLDPKKKFILVARRSFLVKE